jgi:23S rRNA (adenine2030-N6)-methyltransferase
MNYRHSYHAGNFADVVKHLLLILCLDHLQKKEGALCVIDAHAGAGLYDLNSEEANKTEEWARGIGRLLGLSDVPADLKLYLDLILGDLERGHYPGSPLLIARRLRPLDRLIANERHGETFEALRGMLRPFKNALAMKMDGYQCVRAHVPPKERRGLVLIDPPFERKDEFEVLCRQMQEWKRRWARGVFLLWYPIKAHLPIDRLKEAARALCLPRTWSIEVFILPSDQPLTLNGCGIIVFNMPYLVPERIAALLPVLKERLSLRATATTWETADAS